MRLDNRVGQFKVGLGAVMKLTSFCKARSLRRAGEHQEIQSMNECDMTEGGVSHCCAGDEQPNVSPIRRARE